MKVVPINSLSTVIDANRVFCLAKNYHCLSLVEINRNLEIINELAKFKGTKGFLLLKEGERFLVSIDDKLLLIDKGVQKVVFKASDPENFFWHATKVGKYTFIHEYGKPPTGIYVSEDLKHYTKVITNEEVDKHSKHFHSIAYDPWRSWLLATLGDGCPTRVSYSEDVGRTWKPLYKGPWQFVPIEILKDKIIFGMDSGIARGGLGIYYPSIENWEFLFLRWHNKIVRFAQMADIKQLNNGIWISALGSPQVVVVSKDLRCWHPLYIEGLSEDFNHFMKISEGNDIIICSTGKNLVIFDKSELENALSQTKSIMLSYRAYIDRLRGLGSTLKRKLLLRK